MSQTLSTQQRQLLQKVAKGRKDPVYFSREFLDIDLHDGQKFWLWTTTGTCQQQATELADTIYKEDAREIVEYLYSDDFYSGLLIPANRWGKTLVISIKHIWMLYYKIGVHASGEAYEEAKYQTFNISPIGEQAMAAYNYVIDILESKMVYRTKDGEMHKNDCKIQGFMTGSNEATRTIKFIGNRRFRCSTLGNDTKGATAIQGSSYAYGSFDECSEDPRLSLSLPRMKSRLVDMGGTLDLIGTPSSEGKSSQYYFRVSRLGKKRKKGYFTFVGKMTDNKFLDPDYIKQKKREYRENHPELYQQIFFGEFVDTGGKMFDSHEINQIWLEGKKTPLNPPQINTRERRLLLSIDFGFAEKGDPTVGYVIDYTTVPYEIIFHFSERNADPWKMFAYIRELKHHFECPIIMDSNSMGGTMIAKMLADLRPLIKFDYHGKAKEDGIYLLKQAFSWKRDNYVKEDGSIVDKNNDYGKIRSYYIRDLEEQLSWYQLDDKKIEQDHVMALMQGIHYIDKQPPLEKPRSVKWRNPRGHVGKSVYEK